MAVRSGRYGPLAPAAGESALPRGGRLLGADAARPPSLVVEDPAQADSSVGTPNLIAAPGFDAQGSFSTATLTTAIQLAGASAGAASSSATLYPTELPAGYTALANAPQLAGVSQWVKWAHGAGLVIKDRQGAGDLFTFGSPGAASGKLHVLVSQDAGASWAWPADDSYAQAVDSDFNAGPASAAQDSAGNIHLLYYRTGFLDFAYYRLTPTRVAGHVVGYTGFTTAISLGFAIFGGDTRASIQVVTTASAAEVLAVCVACSDVATGTHAQAWVSITSGLAPASANDFTSLTGTAASATLVIDDTGGTGGTHDHTFHVAQLGSTKDLYVAGGNIVADSVPVGNTGIIWVRLTASGATWTVGTPATAGAGGGRWHFGVKGTTNYVWLGWGQYSNGTLRFSRIDSTGTLTDPYATIPAPSFGALTSVTQLGTFNVAPDESRVWALVTRDVAGSSPFHWGEFHVTACFWNGSSWTLDTSDSANAHGIQGNAVSNAYGFNGMGDGGAFYGVVGLQSNCQGTSFEGILALGTYRGGALAAGAAALQGASVGAATSTASLSTGILVAGASSGAAAGTGALTTAIQLAGASAGAGTSAAALATAIQLAGASAGASTTAAALTTAILLGGASAGAATSTGTLTSSGAALAGASVGGEAGAGALTTAILLAGASQGNGSSSGTLTGTAILLAGASVGAASSTASLTTAILLAGASVGAESGTASLGGAAALQGASLGAASSSATLTTGIALAGASVAGEAGAGALTTAIRLAGASVGAGTSTGSLDAGAAQLAGASVGAGSSSATLTTGVLLGGASVGAEVGAWAILWGNAATLTPWARWPFDGDSATEVYDTAGRVAPLTVRTSGGYPARVLRGTSWGWQFNPGAADSGIAGDAMTVPDYVGLVSGEWTLSFWFRRESSIGGVVFNVIGPGALDGIRITISASSTNLNVTQFRRTGTSTSVGGTSVFSGAVAADSTWRHFIIRKQVSGLDAVPVYSVWRDGVSVAVTAPNAQQNCNPQRYPPPSAGRVGIGEVFGSSGPHSSGCPGSLDDLTLYNQACTDAEALALYQLALLTGPWAYPGTVRQASLLALGATASLVTLPASASPTNQPGTSPITVEVYPA